MCSICGEVSFDCPDILNKDTIVKMNNTLKHRGPDESSIFKDTYGILGHNRLSVIDIEKGKQPMSAFYGNKKYTIVYNGEIYNCDELRKEIREKNIFLKTNCDTEVVLYAYILYGTDAPKHLNGIFSFAIYDGESLFLARDRFGVKPLYFTKAEKSLIFASEIKAMLSHPSISSSITREGLWELIYLSPNFVSGKSVFKDISELSPSECLYFTKHGMKKWKYWSVSAKPYLKDKAYATEKTRYLVTDAIKRQLCSDVGLCVLLSGGLDSSVVTSVASQEYKKENRILSTYSFEYEGNKESFQKSIFQPEGDDDFATYLANYLGTSHNVLTCPTSELSKNLISATMYRDLPGQADIDSSLLYFCKEIKKNHTVGLSGECSDEIFGGYPWFYREEMVYSDFFPWIHSPKMRPLLFKDTLSTSKEGFEYVQGIYKNAVSSCPMLDSDSKAMKMSRIGSFLSVNYFMTSLLQRKDRMSMASGVEIRVPFADHRIFEFLFNVPWEIKFENGVEKALLRNAMADFLPERILTRKKSPYPKTHNPEYMKDVLNMLNTRLKQGHYLKETLDLSKLEEALSTNKTWFGQLMSAPQLVAWLVQLDFWFDYYNVNIV